MTTELPHSIPQCFGCAHFRGPAPIDGAGLYLCDAYPDESGIPDAILLSEHDHREPADGDHGVRYEPIDTDEEAT